MDPTFTREEQRFVLAEMIKSSAIDIENLVLFVKANRIVPNWMTMQLPLGRNMQQCMHVAEYLSVPSSSYLSRKPSVSQNGHAVVPSGASQPGQATVMASPVNHSPGLPSATPTHISILPRPTHGLEDGQMPLQQATSAAARRRGRPSRADKARRDLRPQLPHIAPRPPQSAPGLDAPRPILPAVSRAVDLRLASPSAARTSPATADGPRNAKRRRTASAAAALPFAPIASPASAAAAAAAPMHGGARPASNNPQNIKPPASDPST